MDNVDGRNTNGIEQIFEGINKDLASLATSGHLADSEGDNGDEDQEDEEVKVKANVIKYEVRLHCIIPGFLW